MYTGYQITMIGCFSCTGNALLYLIFHVHVYTCCTCISVNMQMLSTIHLGHPAATNFKLPARSCCIQAPTGTGKTLCHLAVKGFVGTVRLASICFMTIPWYLRLFVALLMIDV